jgi:AbrB family looped-hinge helix DNA binding protein
MEPKHPITVKVSSKNQIAVPASARQELNIQPGDHLLVDVQDGMIVLIPRPKSMARHLAGLHRDVWAEAGTDEYLDTERNAWED